MTAPVGPGPGGAPARALRVTFRKPGGHGDYDDVHVWLELPPREGQWCLLLPWEYGHDPANQARIRNWLQAQGYVDQERIYMTGLHPLWLETFRQHGTYTYGMWVPYDEVQALIALEKLGD